MAENKYELGKAYVQVIPTTKGIKGKLREAFGEEGSGAGTSFGTSFGASLKTKALLGVAAAATAAGALMVKTIKDVVNNYGDYEQLTGGVEKLFEESSARVVGYAEQAYKTAGISKNAYMEQITSFAASLISSLDGDTRAAADAGNQAVIDMADNANTFGTSMESIQNAYQGFAKQNYTMLDNLKLGYGGTKQEMERLIADANKLKSANGEMADLSIDSFADIVEAIHLIQSEMKITGTTSKEAATTLQGSAGSAKAAWQNVLTTLGDENGDVKGAVKAWTESVKTNVENTGKVVKDVFKNIPEFVGGVFSAVKEAITAHYLEVNGQIISTGELIEANSKYFEKQIDFLNDTMIPLQENQSYLDQLKGLVDEYGTVAEENLPMVETLIQNLNEKYGTNLELQGNIVKGYDDEIAKIQEAIDAEERKALASQVSANSVTAMENLTTAYEANKVALEDVEEAQAIYNQTLMSNDEVNKNYWAYELQQRQEALAETSQAYETASLIAQQAKTNELELSRGNLDQIILLNAEEVANLGTTEEAISAIYNKKIQDKQLEIETLKNIRNSGNAEIIDSEIAAAEAVIAEAERQKNAQIQAAKEAAEGVKNAHVDTSQAEADHANARKDLVTTINEGIKADTQLTYDTIYNNALISKLNTLRLSKESATQNAQQFKNKELDYYNSGLNSLAGFEAGVKARLPVSISVMGTAAAAMHNALKNYNGEQSPAKRFKRSGKYAMEGYAIGIEDNAKLVESAMTEMAEGVAEKTGHFNIPVSIDSDGLEGVSVLDTLAPQELPEKTEMAAAGQNADYMSTDMIAEVFDAIKATLEDIKEYLPTLAEAAKKDIILDSGELVGAVTPKINDKMGELRTAGNRGITCMA